MLANKVLDCRFHTIYAFGAEGALRKPSSSHLKGIVYLAIFYSIKVFLGYNVNVPNADTLPSADYIPALIKKMQADISACVPYIQSKIDELKLSRHSFYIYVLPLDDVSTDRTTIMNKALEV